MLRNPDFQRLAAGSSLHAAGFQGEQVVASLLLYQLTGSTFWVGVGLALSFLPMLLVGVPAGASADHFDRRKLLPLIELAVAVTMGGVALFFWAFSASVPVLLAVMFAVGCLRAMHHPVRLSYAHDVLGADQLVSALGALSMFGRFGQLLGAVGAGTIAEHFGAGPAYAGLTAAHALALFVFLNLRTNPRREAANGRQTMRENLREYARELRTNPVLVRLTLTASLVEIFGFSFVTALPELVSQQLGGDGQSLGILHGARSVGGFVAGFVLMRATGLRWRGYAYLASLIGFGVALIALSVCTTLWLAMLATAFVAFSAASSDVLVQSMMQLCVSEHLRGRAMGAWVLALGAGPVGHVELGAVVGAVGASAGLLLNGLVLVTAGALVAALVPRVRNF
ncbi:MAG: MFS transporter [Pseudomonadota bacterium]